jgi:hypothetical protein
VARRLGARRELSGARGAHATVGAENGARTSNPARCRVRA